LKDGVSNPPLLLAEDVWKCYSGGAGEIEVLRGVSLQLDAGESVAIVGPSGSGKSTLLNLIGTLDRPTRGRVLLDGADIAGRSEEELSQVRNRRIGFVFQLHHLLPQFNVIENVLMPTLVNPSRASEAGERARRLLARVGLEHRLAHRPGELSGGECQRVAVARALVNRPGLVLADEPTGSLDRAASENLVSLLAEINREEGAALIVVTHSVRLAERMGRVLALRDGRLETVLAGKEERE
jgi:lipoprotein-releasing system ATP-binding protein